MLCAFWPDGENLAHYFQAHIEPENYMTLETYTSCTYSGCLKVT